MDSQQEQAFADGVFEWNDIYTGTAADYQEPDSLVLATVAELPPGRALDVGCGAGGLLVALAKAGWKVTGVDLAENAIRAAEGVLKRRGLAATLHAVDASQWRPTQSFDLITNCFALPNTKEQQAAALAMMKAALAPGGTVVVKDFDASMHRFKHFAAFHCPTVDELREAFEGFEIQRAEIVDMPVHHQGEEPGTDERWTAALLVARRPLG